MEKKKFFCCGGKVKWCNNFKAIWRFLCKLEIVLAYNSATPLLAIDPKYMKLLLTIFMLHNGYLLHCLMESKYGPNQVFYHECPTNTEKLFEENLSLSVKLIPKLHCKRIYTKYNA